MLSSTLSCLGSLASQKQEEARIEKDRAMKKTCETYEQTIKEYGDKISDMMLHIRTRDRQILAVEDKVRLRHDACRTELGVFNSTM